MSANLTEGSNPAEEQAAFNVQKVYLKDVSYEAPNAPMAFNEQGQPELNMNMNQKVGKIADDVYEVVLGITLTCTVGEKTIYLAEVAQAGIFGIAGFDEPTLDAMLGISDPARHPEFRGAVATVYSHPLSKGGSSNGHYSNNAETYMNIGEAMGAAMVELIDG